MLVGGGLYNVTNAVVVEFDKMYIGIILLYVLPDPLPIAKELVCCLAIGSGRLNVDFPVALGFIDIET